MTRDEMKVITERTALPLSLVIVLITSMVGVIVRLYGIEAAGASNALQIQNIKEDRIRSQDRFDKRLERIEDAQIDQGKDIKEILQRLPAR